MAPDPRDVPAQMTPDQLVQRCRCGQPLRTARAAIVYLWLEAIHPFEDGNGYRPRAGRPAMAYKTCGSGSGQFAPVAPQMWG